MSKQLFVLVIFAGFINWLINTSESTQLDLDFSTLSVDGTETVTLYATEWCSYCKKTREFLTENNIEYYEYDIEKSETGRKQYQELNGRGVPLLLIGEEVVRGYNIDALVAALNKK